MAVNFQEHTPQHLQNERRALLALMAERGTEAQAEFAAGRAAAETVRRQGIERAAARGMAIHAPDALQAELTQDFDATTRVLADNRAAAALGHGREMDRIAAANAAYLDAVGAASVLNRDMLAAQLAAAAAAAAGGGGGRGGGGGGRRGGGGGGGGGGFPGLGGEPAPPELGLTYSDFDAFRRATGMSDTETLQVLQEMRDAGELTPEQWNAWGRAAMGGMQIPGLGGAARRQPAPAPMPRDVVAANRAMDAARAGVRQTALARRAAARRPPVTAGVRQTALARRPPVTPGGAGWAAWAAWPPVVPGGAGRARRPPAAPARRGANQRRR